jgi:hypothetical protein
MNFLETAKNIETKNSVSLLTYLDFNLDSSTVDQEYPHLKLITKTKNVSLETYKVETKLNDELIYDLKRFHEVDIEAMVESVLEAEALQARHKNLFNIYKDLGEKSENEILSKFQRFLKRIFPNIKYKVYLFDNSIEGSKRLIRSILIRSNLIAARSRRGPGNFIICNGIVGSLIQDHQSFISSSNNIFSNTSAEIRSIGNIGGNIEVFINPYQKFTDNTIIIGRKTQDHDPGVYIIEDKESKEIVELSTWEGDKMIRKKSLIERLAIVHTENSNKNFLKFQVEFSKKPLWRRILGI